MTDDLVAIQQVLNRYTIGACKRDWPAVLATFMPDAIWQAPAQGLIAQGHDAIGASISVHVDRMDYFVQINAPAAVELAGDAAHAVSAIREFGRFGDGDQAVEVFGLYEDDLVRTEAGWRFAMRTFVLMGMEGGIDAAPPVLSAKA